MSNITIASLPRISSQRLYNMLKSPSSSAGVAVVDVRDSDYIGGHIASCLHVPSSTLDWKMPELIRTLKDKEVVVFHCMLSQQRGPSAAMRYIREKERLDGVGSLAATSSEVEDKTRKAPASAQQVFVLEGGFQSWQEQYGEEEEVTEAYVKDLWE